MLAQQEQIKVDKTHWKFHRLNMLLHGVNYTFTLNLPIDTVLTRTSKWGGVKQITLFFYKLGTKVIILFELCPVFRQIFNNPAVHVFYSCILSPTAHSKHVRSIKYYRQK